jgi:hypothetical protein
MSINPKNLRFFLSLDGLGGPITSTEVDGLSLFPDVRGVEAERGLVDHRCIYFINNDENRDGLIDPHLWFDRAPNTSSFEMGVDPAGQNEQAQVIGSASDTPIGVVFSAPKTSIMPLYLPGTSYQQGDYVALWLRRTVPKGSPPQSEKFILHIEGDSYA